MTRSVPASVSWAPGHQWCDLTLATALPLPGSLYYNTTNRYLVTISISQQSSFKSNQIKTFLHQVSNKWVQAVQSNDHLTFLMHSSTQDESIQQAEAFRLTFPICNGCMLLLNVSLVLHFTTEIALPQGHFNPL